MKTPKKPHARERRAKAHKPALVPIVIKTNFMDVLEYLGKCTPTEIRCIVNSVNAMPSHMRGGKEVSHAN